MWANHMARLSAFHCLAPDFPGCGMSRQLPWTSSIDVAADVATLIRERVPAGRAHVVGISLGGAVAHTLLALHADLVDRLIIDGAGILPWWGDGPFLLFIAAIAPFLHTRPVIAPLSSSVGRIPEADQAELRVASRLASLKSLTDAPRNEGDSGRGTGQMPDPVRCGRKRDCRSTQQRCPSGVDAACRRAICEGLGSRLARHEDGAPPRDGRGMANDGRAFGRAHPRETIAGRGCCAAARPLGYRVIHPERARRQVGPNDGASQVRSGPRSKVGAGRWACADDKGPDKGSR